MAANSKPHLSEIISDDGTASSLVNASHLDDFSSDEEDNATEKEAIVLIQKQLAEIT